MSPLFSVLIANYNNGLYIKQCIDSILQQDYSHIEIIIVDDASTDNSIEIITPYLNQYNHIKLFKNEINKGVGYTKNYCIAKANGDIYGFVDPDDTITPEAISIMVNAHLQYAQASLIYSNYFLCDAYLTIKQVCDSNQVINGDRHFFNDTKEYISHFATFKKKFLEQTQGMNPSLEYAEDLDLYLKLYDIAPCIHIPQPLYYYRIHKKGLSSLKNGSQSQYWRWLVMSKRAEERGISLEKKFSDTFIKKESIKFYLSIDQFIRKSTLFKTTKKVFKR
ncbi:glycosyltransferase family 2 protein [Pedobacter sp.]|uniref:glycosyltransferase family 2 protein n=1 Tax=Pedobacter sp. TaxID=1411316 RepID=UPI00396C2E71